jgi:pyruvate kinase
MFINIGESHLIIESSIKMNKRVKIVATLGPAVEIRGGKKFGDDGYWGEKLDVEASAQKIAELIKEGANVFRFNFSHGDHEEQGEYESCSSC